MNRRLSTHLALGFALLAGCGPSRPPAATITGTVTLDGTPVTAGRVQVAADDGSNSASGEIGPDGTFTLVGGPTGAVRFSVDTSRHKVAYGPPVAPAAGEGSAAHRQMPSPNPRYVATPEKYAKLESSGLTATLPEGRGPHTHDLALTAK